MLSNKLIVAGGLLSSQLATGCLSFAISLYLLDATQSAFLFSLAVGMSFVPSAIISLLSGVWVDRWNKKRVICTCDFLAGLIALTFALTVNFTQNLNALLIYIVAVASVQSLLTLAFNSALPELFNEDDLPSANGLVQSISAVTRIVAPISGALLYAYAPLKLIFFISCSIYFVSVLIQSQLRFIHKKVDVASPKLSYVEAQAEALNYVRSTPTIRFFLLFEIVLNGLYLPIVLVVTPFIIYQVWGVSPFQLSLVEAAMAVGTILGAFIASRQQIQKKAIRYFCLLLIPQAILVSLFIYPFSDQSEASVITGIFAIFFVILASLNTVQNIPVLSKFQRTVPQEMVGRLFGLFFALLNLAVPTGIWFIGSVLTVNNWEPIILTLAAAMALLGIIGNNSKGFHAFVNENGKKDKALEISTEHQSSI